MVGNITKQQLEKAINDHLLKMFNPEIIVSEAVKNEIRRYSLNLIDPFMNIVTTFISYDESDKHFKTLNHRINEFIDYLEMVIVQEPDKHIACSVGLIYSIIFIDTQKMLKDDLLDQLYFQYGEERIRNIMLEKIKK